jgi:hypothetical protein
VNRVAQSGVGGDDAELEAPSGVFQKKAVAEAETIIRGRKGTAEEKTPLLAEVAAEGRSDCNGCPAQWAL